MTARRVLGPPGALDEDLQAVAQKGTRGKAGERVVMRDMVDVLVGALALGQVVRDSDEAGDVIPRCREVQ